MTMQNARLILNSISSDCPENHPLAVEGTMHDFLRANDKVPGKFVQHYAQKGVLYYVKSPLRSQDRRLLAKRP